MGKSKREDDTVLRLSERQRSEEGMGEINEVNEGGRKMGSW